MSSIENIKGYIKDLLPKANDWMSKPVSLWDALPKPKEGSIAEFMSNLLTQRQQLTLERLRFDENTDPKVAARDRDYNKYFEFPSERLAKVAKQIIEEADAKTDTEKMYAVEQWVNENISYELDDTNYYMPEYWAMPTETLNKGDGDCIANYEEVWTSNGLKKVGALEVGDILLSYDFNKKEYCYKPITKIWEKGILPIYRVNFTNGTWIDVTEDHKFPLRNSQKKGKGYIETKVKDIDLSRWWKRKIPCVKKLPYEVKDMEWLTEDLCFVIGHFLAEGDLDTNGHVRTSGYDVPTSIAPILEKHSIPYSITTNNNGVPDLNFLESPFKHYLKRHKSNSFDIHISDELFYLPETKLVALINGHFLGDGHYSKYAENSNKEKTYSTSSYQLAYDIQRIHLQLGTPIYMWLQKDHKGAGNKPIWRLSYNYSSYFSRDYGYEGISEVSIKSIEPIGETEVRDFEVKDTHIFITKTGALVFNCEDMAFLITSLALHSGVDSERIRMYGGYVKSGTGADSGAALAGHGWGAFKRDDGEWVAIEGSYYPTDTPIDERVPMREDSNYVDDFWYVTKDGVVDGLWRNFIRDPEFGFAANNLGYHINIRV